MSSIVGGPVCTRFARGALCVSFLPPGCRLCSFDCTYCVFEHGQRREGWPSPGEIASAVTHALGEDTIFDAIAIAGPGEQTLHPQFGLAVANVLSARQVRPELPLQIHTNGTTLHRPSVRRALELADERVVHIDAGGQSVSRGAGAAQPGVAITALGALSNFSVETVFVDGRAGNTDSQSIDQWVQLVEELRPTQVYVTTIDKPPVGPGTHPVSLSRLEDIAEWVRCEAHVPALAYA